MVTVSGAASNGVTFTVPTSATVYYYIEDQVGSSRRVAQVKPSIFRVPMLGLVSVRFFA